MAKNVTLADIAERVGVSTVAVSKALSGKPGVSEELRNRIQNIADEMGYVSSVSAKSSVSETGNIGVVIPENYYECTFTFYGRLYEKVVRALYENHYYGILELLTNENEKAASMPKVMQDGKVDGLIFLGQLDEAYVRKIVSGTDLPFFFLDTYLPFIEFDTIISDGYHGTYQLTNYLIERGHRNIKFVGSVDVTSSIADRYWGYRRALRENHIAFQEGWEIPDRSSDGKAFEKILHSHDGADAYVCNSDYTAYTVIRDLEEAGYRVPDDVSVVGFDNFLPPGMDGHFITSYEVNMERMAQICVQSLINKIKRREYVGGIQVIAGEIIEKQTVKSRV